MWSRPRLRPVGGLERRVLLGRAADLPVRRPSPRPGKRHRPGRDRARASLPGADPALDGHPAPVPARSGRRGRNPRDAGPPAPPEPGTTRAAPAAGPDRPERPGSARASLPGADPALSRRPAWCECHGHSPPGHGSHSSGARDSPCGPSTGTRTGQGAGGAIRRVRLLLPRGPGQPVRSLPAVPRTGRRPQRTSVPGPAGRDRQRGPTGRSRQAEADDGRRCGPGRRRARRWPGPDRTGGSSWAGRPIGWTGAAFLDRGSRLFLARASLPGAVPPRPGPGGGGSDDPDETRRPATGQDRIGSASDGRRSADRARRLRRGGRRSGSPGVGRSPRRGVGGRSRGR